MYYKYVEYYLYICGFLFYRSHKWVSEYIYTIIRSP